MGLSTPAGCGALFPHDTTSHTFPHFPTLSTLQIFSTSAPHLQEGPVSCHRLLAVENVDRDRVHVHGEQVPVVSNGQPAGPSMQSLMERSQDVQAIVEKRCYEKRREPAAWGEGRMCIRDPCSIDRACMTTVSHEPRFSWNCVLSCACMHTCSQHTPTASEGVAFLLSFVLSHLKDT